MKGLEEEAFPLLSQFWVILPQTGPRCLLLPSSALRPMTSACVAGSETWWPPLTLRYRVNCPGSRLSMISAVLSLTYVQSSLEPSDNGP